MSLRGKRIIVTRAPHQAGELVDLLRAQGAEPLLYPCIAITPPEDTQELDGYLKEAAAGAFDWLVLTSTNTVEALRQRCAALDLSLRGLRTAAVGPATAEAARTVLGVDVQAVPDEYVAEALAETLRTGPGLRILLPQANLARDTLRSQLAAAGTEVITVTSYYTVMGSGGVDLPGLLAAGQVDALTLTSSSTVDHLVSRVQQAGGDLDPLRAVCAACIGPKTADTAKTHAFTTILIPAAYTLEGLVESLTVHFMTKGES